MNIMKRAVVPVVCVLLAGLLFAGCTPAGHRRDYGKPHRGAGRR